MTGNTKLRIDAFLQDKLDFDLNFQVCANLRKRWVSWDETKTCDFETSDLKNFSAGQIIEFLVQLSDEEPLRYSQIPIIDDDFVF